MTKTSRKKEIINKKFLATKIFTSLLIVVVIMIGYKLFGPINLIVALMMFDVMGRLGLYSFRDYFVEIEVEDDE